MATYFNSKNQPAEYEKNSLYAKTPFFGNYLDIASFPTIPKLPSDKLYIVNQTYTLRPDLLAFDLYGDANLWWVFALRNPNSIKDPVFDMKPGVKIFLPSKETVLSALGA